MNAAHDVADGGLFTTLLEMALPLNIGVDVRVDGGRLDGLLFGEAQSRVVLAVDADKADAIVSKIAAAGMDAQRIGSSTGDGIVINGESFGSVNELRDIYMNAFHKMMG